MDMKSKYLFGALLGGFALASCNADENFTSTPSAQESPITFTVSLEDGDALTKAEVTSDMKVNFEQGDLLSLFHGVKDDVFAPTDVGTTPAFTGYQNAIYEGTAKEGEAFKFTTRSMVLKGKAVMIYPADTTFANTGTSEPVISIPSKQNAQTKLLTPHVSEFLDITEYNGNKIDQNHDNTAGYGRNYDVVLKRVGATLRLTADLQNADKINNLDVAPLKLTDVELYATDNSSVGVFTTSISLDANSTVNVHSASTYPNWVKVSEVDNNSSATTITRVGILSTTDITDNTTAVFTLLPTQKTSTADYVEAYAATITVQTNYGKVALTEATGDVWTAKVATEDPEQTIVEGINNILKKTYINESRQTSLFEGELVGTSAQRGIKVDVSNLDMNGLHITDENHLLDALTVYDAVCPDATVTWILDGNADGEFVMNPEAAKAYEERMMDANNKISFQINQETEKPCTIVKFVATELTEVPAALKFVPEGTAGDDDKPSIVLVGPWKYSNENKAFTLISDITISGEATMQISGKVGAVVNQSATFGLINNGAVTVSGTTDLALNLTNNGNITIPQDGQLFVTNGKTLTNEASGLNSYGSISNSGNMGVRTSSNGSIYNYGYIKQENADAYTYVTCNANNVDSNSFSVTWSSTNKIGTIELFETDVNKNATVGESIYQGFIKVITDAATVTDETIGEVANYLVIKGECTACNITSSAIKYIDVQSSKRVIFNTPDAGLTIRGIIVGENYSVNIPKDSKISITQATFLKGYIFYAGTFSCSDYDGYFGSTSSNNAIYQGN